MSRKEYVMKFFKNPLAAFIYAVLLTLAVVILPKREHQALLVLLVCGSYALICFLYVMWVEKISAKGYQEENAKLQERINTIEAEKERLSTKNEELEREVPKVIGYKSVRKKIKINDTSGNATLSMTYSGTNISNRPIQTIKHTIITKKQIPSIKKSVINGEDVIPRIDSKPHGDGYETGIILDALEAVYPNASIESFYEVELDEEFREPFEENKEGKSTHSVYLRADELIMEIEAPDGFIFHPNPRIDVLDVFHVTEIIEEKERIDSEYRPTLDSSRKKIKWIIKYPRLAYKYEIYFHFRSIS